MEGVETADGWSDSILSLLSNGSCDDALRLAETHILKHQLYVSGLVQNILRKIQDRSCNLLTASKILQLISSHSAVDDIILELVDCINDHETVEILEIVISMYNTLLSRECAKKIIFIEWSLQSILEYCKKFANEESAIKDIVFKMYLNLTENLLLLNFPIDVMITILASILKFHFMTKTVDYNSKILDLVLKVVPNPLSTLNVSRQPSFLKHYHFFDSVTDKELALFMYDFVTNSLLTVYDLVYRFEMSLPFISVLLNDEFTKGLHYINCITLFPKETLKISYLRSDVKDIFIKLNYIMVYETDKGLRIQALQCFENLFNCFDIKSKYYILLNFRQHVTHSGTLSLLISKIKCLIEQGLKDHSEKGFEFFRGIRVVHLIRIYCFLKEGAKTNIFNDSEHILASLNFFWFLFSIKVQIADFKGLVDELKTIYLKQLEQLIIDALESLQESLSSANNSNKNDNVEVSNMILPELRDDEMIRSVYCSRNAIELIKMTFDRVVFLIENK